MGARTARRAGLRMTIAQSSEALSGRRGDDGIVVRFGHAGAGHDNNQPIAIPRGGDRSGGGPGVRR
jgi:hypothetical protein